MAKTIDPDFAPERGRRSHQKLKAYMVLECLMRETNEMKPLSSSDIVAYLEDYGIQAQESSVRDDIKEINYVMYMLEYGCSVDVAVEELDSGDYEDDKFIKYSQKKKGYYITKYRNNITENDVRVIAQCIYAAPFVNMNQAEHLVDIACSLVHTRAGERIKKSAKDTYVTKPENRAASNVYYNVNTILEAMSEGNVDEPHIPEKITFIYQKPKINDIKKTPAKEPFRFFKVSPYKLYIDSEYVLLAYNDKRQKMQKFRVSNMADVKLTGEARDGEDQYEHYVKNEKIEPVYNLIVNEPVKIALLCKKWQLPVIMQYFGTGEDSEYSAIEGEDKMFLLTTKQDPNPYFFAYMSALSVKIIAPDSVVKDYLLFLKRLQDRYSDKMSLLSNEDYQENTPFESDKDEYKL